MREYWDAHPYGSSELNWQQTIYLDEIRSELRGKRVLELGCGTGGLSAYLATLADEVAAVDFSEEMLRAARVQHGHVPNLRFVRADICELELDQTFDVVCGVMVLHEISKADYPKLIERLKRHMAPDSFGWFQENSFFNPAFRVFRKHFVGHRGIPKFGSDSETPFDAARMGCLSQAFRYCGRSAEAFVLFQLVHDYVIRSDRFRPMFRSLDRTITRWELPAFLVRNLTYYQHIYFSDSRPRASFSDRVD